MIKVNLLKDKTVPSRIVTIKPQATPLGWVILAVMVCVAGGLWSARYYMQQKVEDLTGTRNRLNLENIRKQDLRKQIDKYEKMRQESRSRIEIIEQLKTKQTGPVILLNQIIQSIPTSASVWLTGLEEKGDQVRITGFTVRGETIPDFMSNLSASGFFKTVDLELYEDQQKEAAKFTLVCVSAPRKRTE
jgi:Tfp pilus assembly protein PilN